MYVDENDNRTPRERIDDSFLRRMLTENERGRSMPRGTEKEKGQLPCNPDERPVIENYRLMDFPLGMVYAPYQQWRNVYNEETALARGTLFGELDKPWEVPAPTVGKGGCHCGQ